MSRGGYKRIVQGLASREHLDRMSWQRRRPIPFATERAGQGGNHTTNQIREVVKRDGTDCWLCHRPVDLRLAPEDPQGAVRVRVIPKNQGGSGKLENTRVTHKRCADYRFSGGIYGPWLEHSGRFMEQHNIVRPEPEPERQIVVPYRHPRQLGIRIPGD